MLGKREGSAHLLGIRYTALLWLTDGMWCAFGWGWVAMVSRLPETQELWLSTLPQGALLPGWMRHLHIAVAYTATLGMLAPGLAWIMSSTWRLLRYGAYGKRWSVLLEDGGLTLVDWRRQRQQVLWQDVLELRVRRWPNWQGCGATVRAQHMRLQLPHPLLLRDGHVLIPEVISRAHLELRRRTWFGARFTRVRATVAER